MKKEEIHLDFIIDRLTNSIQNTVTGDSFPTEISRLTLKDLKTITKRNGWNFNWKKELNDNKKDVYKLTIVNNPNVIQGVISVSQETDHIFMNLLENAPFNLGKHKMYDGVSSRKLSCFCLQSFIPTRI